MAKKQPPSKTSALASKTSSAAKKAPPKGIKPSAAPPKKPAGKSK